MNEKEKPVCFGDFGEQCFCSCSVDCLIETFKSKKIKIEMLREKHKTMRFNAK